MRRSVVKGKGCEERKEGLTTFLLQKQGLIGEEWLNREFTVRYINILAHSVGNFSKCVGEADLSRCFYQVKNKNIPAIGAIDAVYV